MATYLCRWPNGDFSVVSAKNKGDAIEMLDEWGNAEQAALTPLTDCMFDFRLCDDGQIELGNIGEGTYDRILQNCYPELNNAFEIAESDETGEYTEEGRKQIRAAVEFERRRLWDNQPPVTDAETEIGRQMQQRTGAASVVVNRIVKRVARQRLESEEGEKGKPN